MSHTKNKKQKTRLLQITHDLDLGGLQQVIYNICRTIDTSRFDTAVLCMRGKGFFASDIETLGIPVYVLNETSNGADYFAFLRVAKLLRKLQIDVVHSHNTQPFFDGTIGAMLAGVKTVVHTDHARPFPDKIRYMIAEKLMSLYAYKVVGCSEHTTQQLRHYEKISAHKLLTIPNGIDGARFELNIDKKAKRLELGLQENELIIGLAVRLSDQKGITYLLQSMPEILRNHPNTTLLIAGDGDLKEDLQQEASTLGISNKVIFCGPRKDIPEILQVIDIYVLPSKWEGLPMVILEAMAANCPVVATNVGGNATAVIDGETGRLVPPQNPLALAEALIPLLKSEPLRTQYAEKAKKLFELHFTATAMTRRYEQLYLRESSS